MEKSLEKKELPKLPHGEGTLTYANGRDDLICYRKVVEGKRVAVYGKTVKECMKRMKEEENDRMEKAKYYHPTETNAVALLQDAIHEWLFTFKRPSLKGRSFDTIEGTYNNQIKDTPLGRTSIQLVSPEDVQKHLNEIMESKSESTTKKTFNLLNQFFNYYYARDINNNPMNLVSMPRKQVRFIDASDIRDEEERLVLSDDEIERLTVELSKPYKNGCVGYSYGHMLLFVMWSYCRIGEVIALQYKDIDFDSHTVKIYKAYGKEKVRGKESKTKYEWVLTTPKSKKGKRVIHLYDKAFYHLQKHIETNCEDITPDSFLFFSKQGNPLPDQFLNNILAKALKRAGINKKVSIHGLRHTGISYFIRHGVATEVISKEAGHADINVTNNTYYNIIKEQKEDMYKDLS